MRQRAASYSFPPKQRSKEELWAGGEREYKTYSGPKEKDTSSQLGNASEPDLRTHCKQSSHSCTMTCRSIEVITCFPGTYSCIGGTSCGDIWWNSIPDHNSGKMIFFFIKKKKIKSTLFFKLKTSFPTEFSSVTEVNFKELTICHAPFLKCFSFWLSVFILQENISRSSTKNIDVSILKHKTFALLISR